MHRFVTTASALLLAAALAAQQSPQEPKPAAQPTAAERLRELATEQQRITKEWPERRKALLEKAREQAKTGGGMPVIAGSPDFAELVPKAQQFAAEFAGTPDAAQFLVWIVLFGGSDAQVVQNALDVLLETHLDSPELGKLGPRLANLARLLGAEKHAACVQTLAGSGNAEVRAWALLAQHGATIEKAERDGPDYVIAKGALVKAAKDADGTPAAEQIRAAIDLREKYSVGAIAPDVVGEDLDGVAFKLSDYKGKVIFLDFWGDW